MRRPTASTLPTLGWKRQSTIAKTLGACIATACSAQRVKDHGEQQGLAPSEGEDVVEAFDEEAEQRVLQHRPMPSVGRDAGEALDEEATSHVKRHRPTPSVDAAEEVAPSVGVDAGEALDKEAAQRVLQHRPMPSVGEAEEVVLDEGPPREKRPNKGQD